MSAAALGIKIPSISKEDSLFGVLTDADVGIDFKTGRPKISKEVLDEMRQYLLVQDSTERQVQILRIRKQVWELEENTQGQRLLRLEPPPKHQNLTKGKEWFWNTKKRKKEWHRGEKLLSSAIRAGGINRVVDEGLVCADLMINQESFVSASTGNSASFYSASSSGPKNIRKKPRGRPSQWRRKAQAIKKLAETKTKEIDANLVEVQETCVVKRKAIDEASSSSKLAKRGEFEVVLQEEPPTQLRILSLLY